MIRIVAAACALALLVDAGAARPGSAKTSARAHYTRAQASTGHALYEANCSKCHGADLSGISAPSLRGEGFAGTQSVADIYRFISMSMPQDRPGELKPAVYAAILAFIMSKNGHPAGRAVLTPAIAEKIGEML